MSTITALARPGRGAGPRPVPWRRMLWVTWRQHRLPLAGLAALFGVAAAYLLVTGLRMRDAYAAVTSCRPAGSGICLQLADSFQNTYAPLVQSTGFFLQFLPGLVGVFIGAPLLARELETGTFRYAWTQGFGRTRLTVAKLVLLGVAVTAVAGAFSVLVSWYSWPLTSGVEHANPVDVMDPTVFDLLGVAFAAWTLAAFAIGALAGVLIRRVVPAMAASAAAWGGLLLLTGGVLRQRYLEPATTPIRYLSPKTLSRVHGLVLGFQWARGGRPATLAALNDRLPAIHVRAIDAFSFEPIGFRPHVHVDPFQYLRRHGYTLEAVYQPDTRFWTFQWIEAGWLLVLALLLLGATVWLVRRRAG